MWRWRRSHPTSTGNANLNKKPLKVLKHLPSSGGCNRQYVNISCRFCQSLGLVKWMLLWMVLGEGTSTANQPQVETTVHVFEMWKAELGAASFHGWEGRHFIVCLLSGCSGNFMAIKERIHTDVKANIGLFVGPSGRGSTSPVFRVNINYFKWVETLLPRWCSS